MQIQGLYSLSSKTSYRQISGNLQVANLDIIIIVSLWNLAGISVAQLRGFLKSYGKTSYRLVNRGLE